MAYGRKLDSYFALNTRAAAAYAGYACLYTFLPSAVSAVVLFYGGNLVLQGKVGAGVVGVEGVCGEKEVYYLNTFLSSAVSAGCPVLRRQSGAPGQGGQQGVWVWVLGDGGAACLYFPSCGVLLQCVDLVPQEPGCQS